MEEYERDPTFSTTNYNTSLILLNSKNQCSLHGVYILIIITYMFALFVPLQDSAFNRFGKTLTILCVIFPIDWFLRAAGQKNDLFDKFPTRIGIFPDIFFFAFHNFCFFGTLFTELLLISSQRFYLDYRDLLSFVAVLSLIYSMGCHLNLEYRWMMIAGPYVICIFVDAIITALVVFETRHNAGRYAVTLRNHFYHLKLFLIPSILLTILLTLVMYAENEEERFRRQVQLVIDGFKALNPVWYFFVILFCFLDIHHAGAATISRMVQWFSEFKKKMQSSPKVMEDNKSAQKLLDTIDC